MLKKLSNQFLCSSMMLPEHRESLKKHSKDLLEEGLSIPPFDEQQLELWEALLQRSQQHGIKIVIKFLSLNKVQTVSGVITKSDPFSSKLYIATETGPLEVKIAAILSLEEYLP